MARIQSEGLLAYDRRSVPSYLLGEASDPIFTPYTVFYDSAKILAGDVSVDDIEKYLLDDAKDSILNISVAGLDEVDEDYMNNEFTSNVTVQSRSSSIPSLNFEKLVVFFSLYSEPNDKNSKRDRE